MAEQSSGRVGRGFLQRLLPREEEFFRMLEAQIQKTLEGARLLRELVQDPVAKDKLVDRIKEVENEGDAITHRVQAKLNTTFITPFDREDIHKLTQSIDDILDMVNATALRIRLFKLQNIPPEGHALVDTLIQAIEVLVTGIGLLNQMKNSGAIQEACIKVNDFENQGDRLLRQALAAIFNDPQDPILLIKLKEIFENMERATDYCEDVAVILEAVTLKNI